MKTLKDILYILSLPLIITMIMTVKGFADDHRLADIKADKSDKSFAVVELFTSEGCWSCPPADELIAKLQKDNQNKKLFIMAFHVDYWDHQGWKDRFSKAEFTERQRQYASWMKLHTLYTPQLVINGKTEMVGSETSKVLSGIQSAIQENHPENLAIKIDRNEARHVQVSYSSSSLSRHSTILMVLVQKQASSQVTAGENAGKSLSHVQIVRQLQRRILKAKDSFSFNLPDADKDYEIIVFEQNQQSGEIIDATSISL
ncbi:DUF1223 domain-containing protein [Sphingobacterium sp. WOUb80]|uniref:DUF1223 domain-containing protein n=1 Tax=Sphingobacterium sp. WOUb80 TaxID=3234028 RepID=UPI003CED4A37